MRLSLLPILAALVLAAPPAHLAAADRAPKASTGRGAEAEARQTLIALLHGAIAELFGPSARIEHGKPTLRQEGDAMAFRIPKVQLHLDESGPLELAQLDGTLRRQGGQERLSAVLPPEMLQRGADGKVAMRMQNRRGELEALRDPADGALHRVALSASGVTMRQQDGVATLDGLVVDLQNAPDGTGRWNLHFDMRADGLSVTEAERPLRLGRMNWRVELTGLDRARFDALRAAPAGEDEETEVDLLGLLNGATLAFSVAGVEAPNDPDTPRLAALDTEIRLQGLDGDAARLDIALLHALAAGAPAGGLPYPVASELRLELSNLPAARLGAAALGQAATALDPIWMLAELVDAGTVLRIRSGRVVLSDSEQVRLDGEFRPTADAAFGVQGHVNAYLVGLPALKARHRAAEVAGDRDALALLAYVPVAERVGEAQTDGSVALRFEMTADGRFLLNGQDALPLLLQPPEQAR